MLVMEFLATHITHIIRLLMDDLVIVESGVRLEILKTLHALEGLFAAVNVSNVVVENAFHAEFFLAKTTRIVFDF